MEVARAGLTSGKGEEVEEGGWEVREEGGGGKKRGDWRRVLEEEGGQGERCRGGGR